VVHQSGQLGHLLARRVGHGAAHAEATRDGARRGDEREGANLEQPDTGTAGGAPCSSLLHDLSPSDQSRHVW
jgi:hypothetical protein